MNVQRLIEKIENLDKLYGERYYVAIDDVLNLVTQLDEPLRYVKNILARLRDLPLHNREVWLKAIMSEFEQDFSHAKWREGYEQGKLEGMVEREKVTIPQFVADWINYSRNRGGYLFGAMSIFEENIEIKKWMQWSENQELFARAWLDGYEVEKEKRYRVKIKNVYHGDLGHAAPFEQFSFYTKERNHSGIRYEFNRKELEDAGFGWVFDCPGIEIEEVE